MLEWRLLLLISMSSREAAWISGLWWSGAEPFCSGETETEPELEPEPESGDVAVAGVAPE